MTAGEAEGRPGYDPLELFLAAVGTAVDVPRHLAPGDLVVGAAVATPQLAGLTVLYRYDDDLCDDTWVLERAPDGTWASPGAASGASVPEWVLDRDQVPPRLWGTGHVLHLGARVAGRGSGAGGLRFAGHLGLAHPVVQRLDVRSGASELLVAVPPSGLFVAPFEVGAEGTAVHWTARGADGRVLSRGYEPAQHSYGQVP